MKHFRKVHTVFIYIIQFYLFLCFGNEKRFLADFNIFSSRLWLSRLDTTRARPQLIWENTIYTKF